MHQEQCDANFAPNLRHGTQSNYILLLFLAAKKLIPSQPHTMPALVTMQEWYNSASLYYF